ncbi:MAG: VOC family protein [Lacipirellulaceae bacterium]
MSCQPNPVNWFEIPVTDMDRASKFYGTAFDTEITPAEIGPNKMGWFPMEQNVPGAAGTLIMGDGYLPSHEGSLVYFHVAEIDPALEKITTAGGKTLVPRTSIGEYGFIAHFEDTEGNRVALHEKPA